MISCRYVSDAGVDGFDAVCQQKLLQCFGLEPELSRSYPPCLLEWTTNKKKAAMAVYAGFADGKWLPKEIDLYCVI